MKKTMDKAKHFAHEVRLHGGREGGGSSRDGAGRDGGSAEEGLDEQANIKVFILFIFYCLANLSNEFSFMYTIFL